ncbi:WD40 repeat domain-containing protein [Krasilnikovia sp. MM14-A1259]|uniref:WD40 repeat domain-containing protein n=1 Tax=Krasilnikovia sp. MM14-A1259 TaxID=3373539 RepID=UPI003819E914
MAPHSDADAFLDWLYAKSGASVRYSGIDPEHFCTATGIPWERCQAVVRECLARALVTQDSMQRCRLAPAGVRQVQQRRTLLPVTVLAGHAGEVKAVAFDAATGGLTSVADDGTVLRWDPSTGAGQPLVTRPEENADAAFTPGGRLVAVYGRAGGVRVWHSATGEPAGPPITPGEECERAILSGDGRLLAAVRNREDVQIYHVATGEAVTAHLLFGGGAARDAVDDLAFSPDGRLLAAVSPDCAGRVWEAATGRPIWDIPCADAMTRVAFAPDGRSMVTAGGGDVTLWDITGRYLGHTWTAEILDEYGHASFTFAVAFSSDGRHLATGGDLRSVRLWSTADGEPAAPPLDGHAETVGDLIWAPDGTMLASTSGDGNARLWDPRRGLPIGEPLCGHTGDVAAGITTTALSPDGRLLAAGCEDGTVKLWSLPTSPAQGLTR